MRSTELVLTKNQREEMSAMLKDRTLPWQVVKRLEVIRLLDKGCTTVMAAQQLAIRKELVRKYYQVFLKQGFIGLIRLEKPGKETLLTEEIFQSLEAHMKDVKRHATLRELTEFLQKNYGISISEEWLSKRLAMRKQALKDAPWR